MALDIRDYMGIKFDSESWEKAQQELMTDAVRQIEEAGVQVVETMPNEYAFRIIVKATDAEGIDRFALVKVGDVNKDPLWFNDIGIRRMSSIRDWKGDAIHTCAWDSIGRRVSQLLTPEFDDEIL